MNSEKDSSRKVFFDARTRQTHYAGPGRQNLPPANVKEVLIGYFGPNKPSDPEGHDMYRAACLAIERANKAGGYNGLPFRLVPGWSGNRWQSGAAEVVRMAYTHKVWAIIGGIDGPSTHVAEQVVAKARLTLLSPGSTDRTVNLVNVPWMFSCLPGDHLQAPVLAREIESHVGKKPFLLVSSVDHDSHLFITELKKSLVQRQLAPCCHFEFKPGQKDYDELVQKIVQTNAHALVIIAPPQESAQLISVVRKKDFKGSIFAGPCAGSRRFMEEAGRAAEGVVFPLLYRPDKRSRDFEEEFTKRLGRCPDYLAAHTYDAVNLLVAAIRKARLNRPRICDAVRELSPWQGITGRIRWDSLGSNSRPVGLGTVRAGRVICVSTPHAPVDAKPRSSRR